MEKADQQFIVFIFGELTKMVADSIKLISKNLIVTMNEVGLEHEALEFVTQLEKQLDQQLARISEWS